MYPLKQKSQVRETFIAFKALVEKRFNSKIRTLYSDNGGEFVGLRSFLIANGISHLTSPPHTPEHNGISESKHRHIVETGLTLLNKATVPKRYWPYAFATAVYLINRLPSPVTQNLSPYAKLFGQAPNYNKLRVFGCLCFPWLRPYTQHKLDDRSLPCVFVGYSLTQSAYLCLDCVSGRLYTSRHVQFVENSFPFQISAPPISSSQSQSDASFTTSNPIIIPIPVRPLVQAPPALPSGSSSSSSSDHHQSPPAMPSLAPLYQSPEIVSSSIPSLLTRGDQMGSPRNSTAAANTSPEQN